MAEKQKSSAEHDDKFDLSELQNRLVELETIVRKQAEETARINNSVMSIADMIGATNDIKLVKDYLRVCIVTIKTGVFNKNDVPVEVFYDQETESLCKEALDNVVNITECLMKIADDASKLSNGTKEE